MKRNYIVSLGLLLASVGITGVFFTHKSEVKNNVVTREFPVAEQSIEKPIDITKPLSDVVEIPDQDPQNVGVAGNEAQPFSLTTSSVQGGPATTTKWFGNLNPSVDNQFVLGEPGLAWKTINLGLGVCDTLDTNSAGYIVCGVDDAGGGGTGSNFLYKNVAGTDYLVPSTTVDLSVNGTIFAANGSTSSTLTNNSLIVAKDSTNGLGVFYVDSSGNTNVSGTLKIGGNTTLTASSGGLQFRASDATGQNIITNASTQLVGTASGVYNFTNSADGAGIAFYPHFTTSITNDAVVLSNNPFTPALGFSAASSRQNFLSLSFNANQSGSAGWSALRINPAPQNATGGTGTNYLIQGLVSSSLKFAVDDGGGVTASGTIKGNASTAFQTCSDCNILVGGGGSVYWRTTSSFIRENTGLQIVAGSTDAIAYVTGAFSATNSSATSFRIDTTSSGTTLPGFNPEILFRAESATGTLFNAGAVGVKLAGGASYGLNFRVAQDATLVEPVEITSSGTLKISTSSSTVQSIWATGASSTAQFDGRLIASTTLSASTGNEIAHLINCTVKKAAGSGTCARIDLLETQATSRIATSSYLDMAASGTPVIQFQQRGGTQGHIIVNDTDANIAYPSIAFKNDPDVGIKWLFSNAMGLVANGTVLWQANDFLNSINPNNNSSLDFNVEGRNATFPLIFAQASTDRIGFNTSSPWRSISASGTVAMAGLTVSTAGNAVCQLTGGEIVNAGGTTCATSAERFKDKIVLSPIDALKFIGALQIKEWEYKENPGVKHLGPIAEDVEKIDKRFVIYCTDLKNKQCEYIGQPLTLDFNSLFFANAQATKELKAKVENLEAEVALLKKSKTPSTTDEDSTDTFLLLAVFVGLLYAKGIYNYLFKVKK